MKQEQIHLSRDDLLSFLGVLKAGGFVVPDHRCAGRDMDYTGERNGCCIKPRWADRNFGMTDAVLVLMMGVSECVDDVHGLYLGHMSKVLSG